MVYRLPVLPPELTGPEPGWQPKESFSPSALVKYAGAEGGCKRQWAWGALFGVWGLKKSIATLLGSLIHGSLECYLKGGTVYDLNGPNGEIRLDKRTWQEFETQLKHGFITPQRLAELAQEAPKRALAGQHLLPNIRDPHLEQKNIEAWLNIDTTRILGGVERIKISGKIDLTFRRAGHWYLIDHKSTKGRRVPGAGFDPWAYAKTPEQLKEDPQAVLYALDLMLRHNLPSLWIRWIYYLTELKAHPIAKAVDVELHRDEVFAAAYKWLCVAHEMRGWVRAARAGAITPDDVPANPAACDGFGGCSYHFSKGGPCQPTGEVKLSDLIFTGREPAKKETHTMNAPQSLADLYAQAQGGVATAAAAQAPLVNPNNPLIPPEGQAAPVAPPPVNHQLPPGWEMGPAGPRPVAPQGYQYSADGTQFVPVQAAPPPAPPVVVPPPLPQQAPPVVAPPGAGAPAPLLSPETTPVEGGKRKGGGRPKGAKNKAKVEGAAAPADGADDESTYDVLVSAAHDAPEGSPLRTLTVSQLIAVAAVLDAA